MLYLQVGVIDRRPAPKPTPIATRPTQRQKRPAECRAEQHCHEGKQHLADGVGDFSALEERKIDECEKLFHEAILCANSPACYRKMGLDSHVR